MFCNRHFGSRGGFLDAMGRLLQGHLQWFVPCTLAALQCRTVCVTHHRFSERPAYGHLLRRLPSSIVAVSSSKVVSFSKNSTTSRRIFRRGTKLNPILQFKGKPRSKDVEVS